MIISTHIFSRPELYQKLLETAKRQLEWCRNADWEQEETEKQLAELVEARQALIEQISALDQGPLSPEENRLLRKSLSLIVKAPS